MKTWQTVGGSVVTEDQLMAPERAYLRGLRERAKEAGIEFDPLTDEEKRLVGE